MRLTASGVRGWGVGIVLGLVMASVWAQAPAVTRIDVKGRVQIELPASWVIHDSEQRKRLAEQAEKSTGVPVSHVASLAANSHPDPTRMVVRVSFLKVEPPFSQAQVRQEVQANRAQLLRDLTDSWNEQAPTMWAALAKKGVSEVGRSSVAVETLGGQTALVIRYARTSSANSAETVKVAQYHVPLGAEKALITLSYVEADAAIRAAHDRIKASIVIR